MSSNKIYKRIFWIKSKKFKIRCAEFSLLKDKSFKGDILIIPGLSEFIERYEKIAERFVKNNYRVAVLDLPGQGLSSRFGNPETVIHVSKFKLYISSINLIINSLSLGKNAPLIFLGNSLGGFLSLYYQIIAKNSYDNPCSQPSITIAMAPMMGLPLSKNLSFIIIFINKILLLFNSSNIGISNNLASIASFLGIAGSNVKSSVSKSSDYWKNKDNINYYGQKVSEDALKAYNKNNNLETAGPSWNWVSCAIQACNYFFQNIRKINISTPTLILNAEDESVTDPLAQKKLISELKNVEEIVLPSCRHDIIHEKKEVKVLFWSSIEQFLNKHLC